MKQLYKFKSKILFQGLLTALFLLFLTNDIAANDIDRFDFRSSLTDQEDTIRPVPRMDATRIPPGPNDTIRVRPANTDTTPVTTTIRPVRDTIPNRNDTFNLRISKDSLEAPLKYAAADSAVVMIPEKKIILYGKTRTEYQDIVLTAPKVEVDQQTQVVTAVNSKDSTGAIVEYAVFKSGETGFSADTIWYNFKTQVGLTKNTYTQQDEIFVQAKDAKKVNENTTFLKEARFTTCNLDDPHFAFLTNKMKVVNKKVAISGPAHPEFEGVPIPIYLPFGFFPLSQGRHSGFLPPQFTTNEQYGLGLEGLGYYKVISNYWDVRFYGNIYSYGGWTANVNPTYRKRYRYSGTFNLSVQSTKLNFKGDPDFLKNRSYAINWTHAVDGKARPGTNFSANVNAASTKFNELVPNSPLRNFQNQMGSSIAYSKTWPGKPYTLTLTANHNQNNLTRLINISLPDANFNVATQYPFQRKESVGSTKWYEKLGIGYTGSFRNQVSFYDTAFNLKRVIDTLQWGAAHSFPVQVALPPVLNGALIISPSFSWQQVWIAQKFRRKWNPTTQKLDTTINKGFFIDNQISFGLGFNTALYGTYEFNRSRIIAIRHIIRPSFSINYRPDLSKKHFYKTQVDATGYELEFSEFEGALYPGFSKGRTGGISFGIDNNMEMKVKSRKDTVDGGIKRLKLIDGFGFNSGYNFLRDSMKLDLINLYLRTTLFEKISITASSTLNPYQVDDRGAPIAKYAWQGGKFKLGRLQNGSVSVSSSFRSKPKDAKKDEENKKAAHDRLNDAILRADQQRLMDYMQQNSSEFVDFNVPWQISFSYSLSFSEVMKPDYSGFEKDFTSNISFNGSFNLTPKWNFSANGFFDFDTKKLQQFSMSINREMHCWQLSINVSPVGIFRYFSFSISPKASILQDLKINRTRSFPTF